MSGWQQGDNELVSERTFADFAEAMAFVNRVAELAERRNHHPDILVHGWNRVRLTLSTHSAGAITEADHALAAEIDGLGADSR
jgi:4a-hydroxytetrahydrobiopterin dehydratase